MIKVEFLQLSMYYFVHVYHVPEYSSPPLIKGHPFCQENLSLLESYPLVRGSTTCIRSTCCQKYVSFIEGRPF